MMKKQDYLISRRLILVAFIPALFQKILLIHIFSSLINKMGKHEIY